MNKQDIKFLLIIIDKLMPNTEASGYNAKNKLIAFQKLNSSIDNIQKYFPIDFAPEKEYRNTVEEKY